MAQSEPTRRSITRFTKLLGGLLNVPKAELDAEKKRHQRRKKAKPDRRER
jgi:hypothetical protein